MRIAQEETAVEAFHAHHASGKAGIQCLRILNFIRSSGGDWSIGELARELEMEKSTASARINELLREQKVVAAPRRKDRVSGVTIRPVKLAPVQREMF